MAGVLDEIEARIRSLEPDEKAELLRSLIADLDGAPERDAAAAWIDAATRRHQDIVQGSVSTAPGDEVFRKARARLKR